MKLSKIACTSLVLVSTNILSAQESNLGEITITGEKLERSLQETTTSVQVFNNKRLENNTNLTDMKDVVTQVSNVTADRFGYKIRGLKSYKNNTGTGAINVTLDGAPLSYFSMSGDGLSSWDLEQVEVLKGPQSTSQGRNSLAGAIVLKTKDPEFKANGKARVSYGQYNTSDIALMQTGPITDNLAFRLSAQRKASDNFSTNDFFEEDDFAKSKSLNIRGKLLYLINDESDILLTISKTDKKANSYEDYFQGKAFERKNDWNTRGYNNNNTNSNSLEYNLVLNDNWNFKSLTTYTKTDHDRLTDKDGLKGDSQWDYDRYDKDFSQEFRFDYKNDKLKTSVGLYYLEGKKSGKSLVNNVDGSALAQGAPLKLDYSQFQKEDYSNAAIFFNLDYELTDRLTLISGLRIDKDKRENKSNLDIKRANNLGPANGIIDSTIKKFVGKGKMEDDNSLNNVLPKLGLLYKINENVNAGFVFSKGYRPGGISVNPIRSDSKKYDPEFTNNYEFSLKSSWLEKKLIANANIFYTQYKDQQISIAPKDAVLKEDLYTENAGESNLKGLEFETIYEVNDVLQISSSLGYVKTEYKKYTKKGKDYSKNQFRRVPKITGNLGFYYKALKNAYIATNLIYTGNKYNDDANEVKIASNTTVNTKIGYKKHNWHLSAYANNVFNKEYYTGKNGKNNYSAGKPRIIGANIEYTW